MPITKHKDPERFERELAEMRERWRGGDGRGDGTARRLEREYRKLVSRLMDLRVGGSFVWPARDAVLVRREAEGMGLLIRIDGAGSRVKVTRLSRNEQRAA